MNNINIIHEIDYKYIMDNVLVGTRLIDTKDESTLKYNTPFNGIEQFLWYPITFSDGDKRLVHLTHEMCSALKIDENHVWHRAKRNTKLILRKNPMININSWDIRMI